MYARGEYKGPPRGLRPCRASHGDYVAYGTWGQIFILYFAKKPVSSLKKLARPLKRKMRRNGDGERRFGVRLDY